MICIVHNVPSISCWNILENINNVIIIQRTKVSKRSIRIQPIFSKKFCEWNCLIVTVIVWCFETIRAPAGSGNCSCHSLWGIMWQGVFDPRVTLTKGQTMQSDSDRASLNISNGLHSFVASCHTQKWNLQKNPNFFYHLPLAWLNLSSLFKSEFKVNHFPILETGAALHEHKVSLSRMGASLSIVLRHLLFMLYHIRVSVPCHIPEAKDRWVCLFYDCSFDLDGIFAPDFRNFLCI